MWNVHLSSERTIIETNLVERTGNQVIVERKLSQVKRIVLREERNLPMVVKV
jgi:hypothetical protein